MPSITGMFLSGRVSSVRKISVCSKDNAFEQLCRSSTVRLIAGALQIYDRVINAKPSRGSGGKPGPRVASSALPSPTRMFFIRKMCASSINQCSY